MMATMMKVMNQMLGSNNFAGMNSMPYSPTMMPGMGYGLSNGMNGLYPLTAFPMSPGGLNTRSLKNAGSRFNPATTSNSGSNFWDPDAKPADASTMMVDNYTFNENSMNGIWQSQSGDVIAIYNDNRFLWSDGGAKNLAGQLAIEGNKMIAYIPAKKITLYFQFYREPGQFVVRDRKSRTYNFKRIH